MSRTHIDLALIDLGPDVPLSRRGCRVEASMRPGQRSLWHGTPFQGIKEHDTLKEVEELIKSYGDHLFWVLKKLEHHDEVSLENVYRLDLPVVDKLVELGVLRITEDEAHYTYRRGSVGGLGALFEVMTVLAVEEVGLQPAREVKIRYPYPEHRYDPDGQKYDVLAGLDLTRLLWIECKKPLYLKPSNALNTVLSADALQKFLKRADFLAPDIAIYLVDTKDREAYLEKLMHAFAPSFVQSERFTTEFFEECNIVARIDRHVYFCLVDRTSQRALYRELVRAVRQVLHDARHLLLPSHGAPPEGPVLKRDIDLSEEALYSSDAAPRVPRALGRDPE